MRSRTKWIAWMLAGALVANSGEFAADNASASTSRAARPSMSWIVHAVRFRRAFVAMSLSGSSTTFGPGEGTDGVPITVNCDKWRDTAWTAPLVGS